MAYNLAEVLEQHVDRIQIVGTTDLGQYVSDQLADAYPRLSPKIYDLNREISIVPQNHKEIKERFNNDISVEKNGAFTLTYDGLKTTLAVPLVVLARIETEKKYIPSYGSTSVEYELKNNPKKSTHVAHGVHLSEEYGKQEISIKGKWTYNGKIESIEVNVPKLPEQAADIGTEAQLQYFHYLTEAKKTKNFTGQTLPQPELYILWIPRKGDFEVKLEEIEIVHPDPALILRVDKKHDHVISLWHTETEEPLEFLVRRHTQ